MKLLWEEESGKSMQSLMMDLNKRYLGKCFHQVMELGIYPGQIPVLSQIVHKEGCSQKEIADSLHIKPPTVNVTIARLEKAGLVCRRQDTKDQRISRIYLTDMGRDVVQQAMEKIKQNEELLFGNFDEAELCLLRRFFKQLLANIDKLPVSPEKNIKKEGVKECCD